jgi:hypothetical protein
MTITINDFLQTIAENEGEALATSGRRAAFRAELDGNKVVFIPSSTGSPRKVYPKFIQKYLDVYNETQSINIASYPKNLVDTSYVPAIIQLWLGQQQADKELTEQEIEAITEAETDYSAPEGKPKLATHLRRERRPELVQLAKRVFRANNKNRLFCEICLFDFGPIYGEPDFIEAHHRIPLRDCPPGHRTKISDLAMVCANCHRMLHRGNPWPTVEELKARPSVRALAQR